MRGSCGIRTRDTFTGMPVFETGAFSHSAKLPRISDDLMKMKKAGGESGIRTHVTVSRKHAFQACALSHSAISPIV